MKNDTPAPAPDRAPPYSMPENPVESPVKTGLLAVLAANRLLANAAQALADTWAADLSTRNRPKRQALTGQLMAHLPRPLALGTTIDAIARECAIDLDSSPAVSLPNPPAIPSPLEMLARIVGHDNALKPAHQMPANMRREIERVITAHGGAFPMSAKGLEAITS